MNKNNLEDIVLGKPAPLVSTFRLRYHSILNLMSRADGQFSAEHLISNSFHQFQYEKTLPEMKKRVSMLEQKLALLDAAEKAEVSEYHKLKLKLAELQRKMSKKIRPDNILPFLCPGRLIKVRERGTDWGWGVVVDVVQEPVDDYIVDTLLHCSPGSNENSLQLKPCPPFPGEKGEMHVVPVQLTLIYALSQVKISLPHDIRPLKARQDILLGVQEICDRFPQGLPTINPAQDNVLKDSEIVELVKEMENLEKKLLDHPMHKIQDVEKNNITHFQRKADLNHEIQQLKEKMQYSQLQKFREELKNRSQVLKELGHIDADSVVQLKGKAACLIDMDDVLLVTELLFNGTFNHLDHHQVTALASCFMPIDKSSKKIQPTSLLERPLQQLQDSARRIAEIECKYRLRVNVNKYVKSTERPVIMDAIHSWSKGSSFADVTQMTDIFEGSIITAARRLVGFLNQLRAGAEAVGENDLAKKFTAASESIRRGIIFTDSLYL
ncbi:putative RNA helicase [Medicago truncatula]|nr:putative RNA helicase [Medicago truncatula]